MKLNRRGIIGLIAGAPLAAKAVAENVLAGGVPNLSPPNYPPSSLFGLSGGVGQQSTAQIAQPLMERGNALRAIFGNAEALAEIRSELFAEQTRYSTTIDPDIMVLKSISPMAKITFQRQRNVERALAELGEERWDRPQRYVRAFNDRFNKLMWGK